MKNLNRLSKEQIITAYNRLYHKHQLLEEYDHMHRDEIDSLYRFIKSKGYYPGDVIEYLQEQYKADKIIEEEMSEETYTKITSENIKLLNDCIIDLMGNSYQTRIFDNLEDMICIHKAGQSKFNNILDKHSIRITNTHGFKEYWIEDKKND